MSVAVTMSSFREYMLQVNALLRDFGLTSFVSTFNQLVGFDDTITAATIEMYGKLGNIYAGIIGKNPVLLTNLNAMIPFVTVLPAFATFASVKRQLKSLVDIENIHLVIDEIAKTSDILDNYGRCKNFVEFRKNLYPFKTKSGYLLSNLLGAKDLITHVRDGVQCFVETYYGLFYSDLLVDALFERALDDSFGNNSLSVLYKKTNCDLCNPLLTDGESLICFIE